jgi:hypothetical protein
VVRVPSAVTSKTIAFEVDAPGVCGPVKFPIGGFNQPAIWRVTVREVEAEQKGVRAGWRQAENGALAMFAAADRGPVEGPIRSLDKSAVRDRAIRGAGASRTEAVQRCKCARQSDFEDGARGGSSALGGAPVKVSVSRLDERGDGAGAVRSSEVVERCQGTLRGYLENGAQAIGSARIDRAAKISVRRQDEFAVRIDAVCYDEAVQAEKGIRAVSLVELRQSGEGLCGQARRNCDA